MPAFTSLASSVLQRRTSWHTSLHQDHRLESRMRETRTSGSEGGAERSSVPTPYQEKRSFVPGA
jgi:hypothetical protein